MAPKHDQLEKMIGKAEDEIQRCREALVADPAPDAAAEENLLATIDAQLAKIERLQSQQARLEALKKGGKK